MEKNKNHYDIVAQSIRTIIRAVVYGSPHSNVVPPSWLFVSWWNHTVGDLMGTARIEPYEPYAPLMGPVYHKVVIGDKGGDFLLYISRTPYEHERVSVHSTSARGE